MADVLTVLGVQVDLGLLLLPVERALEARDRHGVGHGVVVPQRPQCRVAHRGHEVGLGPLEGSVTVGQRDVQHGVAAGAPDQVGLDADLAIRIVEPV